MGLPSAKTAQTQAVADFTEIDPKARLRKITENEGHLPEDLAFIGFPPPCETNSSMQRVNESKDNEGSPVTWHRYRGGEAREAPPPGNLAQKHGILVLKWAQWLTSQWGEKPCRSQNVAPELTAVIPGAHRQFTLTYTEGTTDVAPYQPWPEVQTTGQAPSPELGPPAQAILT